MLDVLRRTDIQDHFHNENKFGLIQALTKTSLLTILFG